MSSRHISFLYDLITPDTPSSLIKIKTERESELGISLSNELWEEALKEVNACTSCAKLQLIQFKILHSAHYSKTELSKIYPDINDSCERCSQSPRNHTHVFWSYPKLTESFFKVISEVLGLTIRPDATIAIFGIPGEGMSISVKQAHIISFASLIAHRRILLLWKQQTPLSSASWLRDIMSFLDPEKIKFSLRGATAKFLSTLYFPF